MAVLITGGSGYIGSYLVQKMHSLYPECLCLAPSHAELDITDYDCICRYLKENDIKEVIHLAAQLDNTDYKSLFCTNIAGVYNLLMAAVVCDVKYFMFVSSNNVYGSRNERIVFSENDERRPAIGNNYGLSKLCGEYLVDDILKNTKVLNSIVRIGDVYGPFQKTGALLKAVIANVIDSKPQKLYGLGVRTRDYIYIDDVVNGLLFILNSHLTGPYNLSTGKGNSVKDIIDIAETLSDCTENRINVDMSSEDISHVVLDVTKLCNEGFKNKYSLYDGMSEILAKQRREN